MTVDGDDPVALVVSLNVRRRNLTASQRAIAAAEAVALRERQSPGKKFTHAERKQTARAFGSNDVYLANARALVERDPDAAAAEPDRVTKSHRGGRRRLMGVSYRKSATAQAFDVGKVPTGGKTRQRVASLFGSNEKYVQQGRRGLL